LHVNHRAFGFLDANNGAPTFLNLVPNGIPFIRSVATPNIPTQNIPISTIHDKEDGEVQEALMPALVRNTRGKLGMESYYNKTDRDTTSSWHKRIR
jgi:hypothetical protein